MNIVKTKVVGAFETYTETSQSDYNTPEIFTNKDFLPIDLFSASFGSCISLYVSVTARKNNFEIPHIGTEIEREMSGPKVSKFDVKVIVEGKYTDEQKQIIENAAKNCPVANSLNQDIIQNISFIYN